MMYHIYLLQNKNNSKLYVGQTNNLKRRFSRHKYEAITKFNKNILYQSIRKHGFDNFELIELEQHTKETIDEAEIFWIEFFQSNKKEFGYNLTKGGKLATKTVNIRTKVSPMLGKKHSPETKKKMSEQRKGANNSFYGKTHTIIAKQKMSQNPNRKYIGAKNPFFGKHFIGSANASAKLTEEIVLKVREQFKNGMTFVELSKIHNVSESTISRLIRRINWNHI